MSESFWRQFFDFIKPSIQFKINRTIIEEMPEKILQLDLLIRNCETPGAFLDFGPQCKELLYKLQPSQIRLIAASAFVAQRYERIRLSNDLLFSWNAAVQNRQLTAAALLSRAMTELAADIVTDHNRIRKHITMLSLPQFIDETSDLDSKTFTLLFNIRYAGRIFDYENPDLKQANILGALNNLPDWIKNSYDELSEICHPNSQSTAIYWKIRNDFSGGFVPIEYVEDLQESQSPFKIQIASGPLALAGTCPIFAELFWSLATCISLSLEHVETRQRELVGLPLPPTRNDLCFCNSEIKIKNCSHAGLFQP